MPTVTSREKHAVVCWNNVIYVFGGISYKSHSVQIPENEMILNSIEACVLVQRDLHAGEEKKKKWKTIKCTLNGPGRYDAEAIACEGSLEFLQGVLVCGGRNATDGPLLTSTEWFNGSECVTGPCMLKAHDSPSLVCVQGKIFILGSFYTNTCEVLEVKSSSLKQFKAIATRPQIQELPSLCVSKDQETVYLLGGGATKIVLAYSILSDTWNTLADLKEKIFCSSPCVYENNTEAKDNGEMILIYQAKDNDGEYYDGHFREAYEIQSSSSSKNTNNAFSPSPCW